VATVTILKREASKAHTKSVDPSADTIAVAGVVGNDDGAGIVVGAAGTGASTGSALEAAAFTATELGYLTPANGMMAYNSTDAEIQGYFGAAWNPWLLNEDVDLDEQTATGTSTITRTLATYAVVTGMTITPGAGTWLAIFSTAAKVNKNSRTALFSVFSNGVQVQSSEREIGGQANNMGSVCSTAVVTVTAGQAIDARWRLDATTSSPTVTAMERTLILVKVGP